MVTEQLLAFIKSQLSLGVSKDAISQMLTGQGWTNVDIEQAFATVNPPIMSPAPALASTPIAQANPVVSAASPAPVQTVQPIQSQTPPVQYTQPVQQKSHSKRNVIVTTIIILVVLSLIVTGLILYFAKGFFSHPVPVVNTPFTTTNLLINPGAETGDISDWTSGMASTSSVDNGSFDKGLSPHSGNYDFFGHHEPLATLSQTISLIGNQGITASMIDGGNLFADVSFWEQGLAQGEPSDSGSILLTFLGTSNNIIGTTSTPIIDSHDKTWKNSSSQYSIPAGTRSIGYTMNFIRHQGSDNDAFVDDNSLIVTNSK